MRNDQLEQEPMRAGRYKVGDQVRIVYGREAGRSGVITQILQERWRVRYAVEVASGHQMYCEETDLALATP